MAMFIDTSFILALINSSDEYHVKAKSIAREAKGPFVTTEAILTEVGNALSKRRWRHLAVSSIRDMRNGSAIDVVPIDEHLFDRAVQFYSSRMDKDWGLTDCISFVVMEERSIKSALTADEHFHQAGFRALLSE